MTVREIYNQAAKEQKAAESTAKGKKKEVAPLKFSFERGHTKQQAKRKKDRETWEREKNLAKRLKRRGL